ncbi:MAG: hypothetical protein RR280_08605 [Bacteroidaceae bacterium]
MLSITNPLVKMGEVTEVYALYAYMTDGKPDATLLRIDPKHAYSVQERIEMLKKKSETTVTINGLCRGATLRDIFVV